jgi:nicotinate-nucleotide adenylyltransferase
LLDVYGAGTELFFLMGADSFEEIGTWREPRRILAASKLIVTSRPGYELRNNEAIRAELVMDLRGQVVFDISQLGSYRVFLTDCVQVDASSTEIRRRVRQGEPIAQFVPPQVAEYITRYGLYGRETNGSQGKERDDRQQPDRS